MSIEGDNVVVIFHSYPKGPCIDGLTACLIACKLFNGKKISFIPYWRTEECFENMKAELERINSHSILLVYIDCSPDLPIEIEYLKSNLEKFASITVYDHHPLKHDTPMKKLLDLQKFSFVFDADKCASLMLYNVLSDDQKATLDIKDLITMVQFSEYLGMNSQLSGERQAKELSERVLRKVHEYNPILRENVSVVQNMNVSAYYIIDQLIPPKNAFQFLYSQSIGMEEKIKLYKLALEEFKIRSYAILAGKHDVVFNVDAMKEYVSLIEESQQKLEQGFQLNSKLIGDNICNVFVVSINIFKYGRTLELYVTKTLENKGCVYAVLMNPPTTNISGEVMHYFSLRRLNKDYDARDLAKYVMKVTGSKVGGGHPWASGVTLNESERNIFIEYNS